MSRIGLCENKLCANDCWFQRLRSEVYGAAKRDVEKFGKLLEDNRDLLDAESTIDLGQYNNRLRTVRNRNFAGHLMISGARKIAEEKWLCPIARGERTWI